jgi:aquaporin Z
MRCDMHPRRCRPARSLWHPEYLFEAVLLGAFMMAALAFTVLVEHPDSPVRMAIAPAIGRRLLIGLGMGATAITLIYSPWGRRSGAHMNPATTLTFARLGLVSRGTGFGYIAAQFAGGTLGVWLGRQLFGPAVEHAAVRFAVTRPDGGLTPAFLAELTMTALLMGAVLAAARSDTWRPRSGVIAAACVATFITIEAPVSGMSLNPARSFASALWAGEFAGLWLYFLAPALGMLLAAEIARHQYPASKDSSCSTTT